MKFILTGALIVGLGWLTGCERQSLPPEMEPQYQTAQAAVAAENFAAAAASYQRVLDKHPQFARGHLELARLWEEKLGDPVAAIYHYRRFMELEPNADKRRIVEGFVQRARRALQATPALPAGMEPSEWARQNEALAAEVATLRQKLAELEGAGVAGAVVTVHVETPPAVPVPPVTNVVTAPAGPRVHVVQRGETLYSIAVKYYGTGAAVDRIYQANKAGLPDKNQLRVGQQLVIP